MPIAKAEIEKDGRFFVHLFRNQIRVAIDAVQLETKLSFPGGASGGDKAILIGGPSPNEQTYLLYSNSLKNIRFDGQMLSEYLSFWANQSATGRRFALIFEQKIWRKVSLKTQICIPTCMHQQIARWGRSIIFPSGSEEPPGIAPPWSARPLECFPLNSRNALVDISPQLHLGGGSGLFHQVSSSPPQREGEQHKQSISNLQLPVQNGKGPVLGSLLTAMIGLVIASACYRRAGFTSILLAFISTVGLLFGFDLWSLADLIWR
jgi:hypothetical protein